MAPIKEGTGELINHIAATLATLPPMKRYEAEIEPYETHIVKKELRTFTVRKDNGEYFVENCDWIESIMNTVDPDDYESLQYFERVLRSSGIIKALVKAGVEEGDVVHVNDFEFEYVL
jgi:GTP-binding protein